jgi:hypothetical protein
MVTVSRLRLELSDSAWQQTYVESSFAPFRASNSDFVYIEEGESTSGYIFTPCAGSLACPGTDIQVQGISVLLHIIQKMRQLKTRQRSQARWSMMGIEPTMFGSRVRNQMHALLYLKGE